VDGAPAPPGREPADDHPGRCRAAAGSLLLGSGRWPGSAVAAVVAETGTIAGGSVVNGRHLSFGDDPATHWPA
jgi:hypothetical protein